MKKLLLSILAITLTACVSYPEQPSRVEEVTLPDGKVVQVYITGYSIEDFMCEFNYQSVGCED